MKNLILIAILMASTGANAAGYAKFGDIKGETSKSAEDTEINGQLEFLSPNAASVADDLQKIVVLCSTDTSQSAQFEMAYLQFVNKNGGGKVLQRYIMIEAGKLLKKKAKQKFNKGRPEKYKMMTSLDKNKREFKVKR